MKRRKFLSGMLAASSAFRVPLQSGNNTRGFDHVALPMQNTDAMIIYS